MDWLTPSYWISTGNPDAWATVLNGVSIAVATILSVAIAAYLTYRFAKRSNKAGHETTIKVDRLKREIEALEKVWELLSYMSFRESDQAIIIWRQEKNEKSKQYYFVFSNVKAFLFTEISRVFYHEHAGLHIPDGIREELFKYCSKLMSLYMRHHKDSATNLENPIRLEKIEQIDSLRESYEILNKALRKEREQRYSLLLSIT